MSVTFRTIVEAFRRQWRRGMLAGLGLVVLLFLLAFFLMDLP